jgi:TfoX/Sxy family transcriptional regulator of competence genes
MSTTRPKSAKPASAGYAEKLALYEKLVATNPEVTRKGDTMPYTSLNGHMFSLFTKEATLILRLAEEDRDAFITKYASRHPVQYGAVMREYVEVPDALLAKTRELKKYFDQSYAYVGTLKPKPATKKKKG